jgi:hypothetical protein
MFETFICHQTSSVENKSDTSMPEALACPRKSDKSPNHWRSESNRKANKQPNRRFRSHSTPDKNGDSKP